jgi:hypothetical protein
MSLLPESRTHRSLPEPDHPRLLQRPHSVAEQRARWEVRAAQWHATELAEIVFGGAGDSSLLSLQPHGTLRGLLRLRVPFINLAVYRDRESQLLAAVEADPILTRVRLVYVIAPDVT